MQRDRFYITTPIYYPDNRLHIGHTYTTVAADALARYHRLRGRDTYYLTGTDEHGQKIQQAAAAEGISPQEFVDEMVDWIKNLWEALGISWDGFIRTTDQRHVRVVQDVFSRLHQQDDIYSSTYAGWYCTPCESFFPEGKVPDGKCPDCGREVVWVEEDAYFLRLSKYADAMLRHIADNPEFIQPVTRRNEMVRFLESGLEDMCVTRRRDSLQWGIPVPFDPDYVIYVWFDAVCNYISAIGYGEEGGDFERWWPADVHLIGKEILRFHCLVWPIMLMAVDLPLPRQVFGHGWLTLGGQKISKSRGNVVDPLVLREKYGRDVVRYYLLREIPFGADGKYTERALVERTNVDLANDLGNLLSRVTAMIDRYCEGVIPSPGPMTGVDRNLATVAGEAVEAATGALERNLLSNSLEELWVLVNAANKYIDETAPWSDGAADGRRETILYNTSEVLRILAVALRPFLVDAPAEIWRQLGLQSQGRLEDTTWNDLSWGLLRPGAGIDRGSPLFPRLDPEEVLEKEEAHEEEQPQKEEIQPMIDFDTFSKMDLRVARVIEAERIEGADRLLRLVVNVGHGETRQVVAGIAQYYDPKELAGRQVVMVANLEPARLFGVESQGMILTAQDGDDLSLLSVEDVMPPGSKVK
ncbi:MAG: methionine--tRNA ligase [Bacillota bacterium]